MNWNAAVTRKAIYVGVIALLLFPLFMLGQPAMSDPERPRPGGVLAQLRAEHSLSQAQLGEIDPASESMKLATLGMKGVAATILSVKTDTYRRTENWDGLSATLNQITKLQPNFISVWEYQGHNLSYNISVEFDDYRTRYHWVTKGIDYLIDGTEHNRDNPRLLWSVAWFLGQKIGRSDEKVAFRRLYRVDNEFHDRMRQYVDMDSREILGPDQLPDNWLTGMLWYRRAEDVVLNTGRAPDAVSEWYDNEVKTYQGKSPLVFHSNVAMAPVNFAQAIEDEGHFGGRLKEAWRMGEASMEAFSHREIPTSEGISLRLSDRDRVEEELDRAVETLEGLVPGLRERIRQAKRARLSEVEIKALNTPDEERTMLQVSDLIRAQAKLVVYPLEMVVHPDMAPHRREARVLAKESTEKQARLGRIKRYRDTVNFDYWITRCEVEQQDRAINARRAVFQAEQAYAESELVRAKELYEASFRDWAGIYRDYPSLNEDETSEELFESTLRYEKTLSQLDTVYPADFPLTEFVNKVRNDRGLAGIRLGEKPDPNAKIVPLSRQDADVPSSTTEERPPEPLITPPTTDTPAPETPEPARSREESPTGDAQPEQPTGAGESPEGQPPEPSPKAGK